MKELFTGHDSIHVGIGTASGDGKASKAVQTALESPCMKVELSKSHNLAMIVSGGIDIEMNEIRDASNMLEAVAPKDAKIIFGTIINSESEGKVEIIIFAVCD